MVDRVLKVDTPFGPCWRRFTHDGYGQKSDGGPYDGWGQGRAWPQLTGERGHYELAAGHDVEPYLRTLEAFTRRAGLLSEQVWDTEDLQEKGLARGEPTGAAMPLMWAHSEYIRLARSAADGHIYDIIPNVAERYQKAEPRRRIEVWKPAWRARSIRRGSTLRVQAPATFRLHWSNDEWRQERQEASIATVLDIFYVDIDVEPEQGDPIRFLFAWEDESPLPEEEFIGEIWPTRS